MEHVLVGALVLSGIIQLSIGIYVIVQSNRGKNLWFSCLAVAASVYSFGYALELTAQMRVTASFGVACDTTGPGFDMESLLNLPRLKSRDSCFIDRCHCWSYTVSTGVASGSSCRTD